MTRSVKTVFVIVAILVVLTIAIEWLLPLWLLSYFNQKLAQLPNYQGHIQHIDMQLWRGAYRIDQISISKQDSQAPVPLFAAEQIFLSISWPALWQQRALVAEISFEQPQFNWIAGQNSSDDKSEVDWRQQLRELFPIKINSLQVNQGQLAFYDFSSQPKVHLYASAIQAQVSNLTNIEDTQGQRIAKVTTHGQLFDAAPIEVTAEFDPLTDWQNFLIKGKTSGVALTNFNDFTQAYAKFDFNKGSADVVLEVEAKNSALTGYIKPLLHDVEVFNRQQDLEDPDKSVLQGVWEAIVGGGESVLKNQQQDQFASKINLKGSTKHPKLSPFQAFLSVLKNGFVQAFTPTYETPKK